MDSSEERPNAKKCGWAWTAWFCGCRRKAGASSWVCGGRKHALKSKQIQTLGEAKRDAAIWRARWRNCVLPQESIRMPAPPTPSIPIIMSGDDRRNKLWSRDHRHIYGDLSQVTQVVSADYDDGDQDPIVPFSEKNLRVFTNASSRSVVGGTMSNMNIQLCDTFDDLLNTYFSNFRIEGTDKPWKAFMGDWVVDEILRTMGINMYDGIFDNCCYVLVKWTKVHTSAQLDDLSGVGVKEHVDRAIDALNISDAAEIRRFMKSYGTHYIDSYVTGNFIYQVFKYKRSGYHLLRSYIKLRSTQHPTADNLRFYFASYFLKQVGDIRVASGNKTVEAWARKNLRESQYLYSRPSLLKLHYSPSMAFKLNELLDSGALLGLDLKTLRPLFKDRRKGDKFAEIVQNDLQLWEVNS